MDLAEISDRLEIENILVDYCHAIDDFAWEALDRAFTPDAIIDYTELALFRGNLAEAKAWLAVAMAGVGRGQHIVSASQIRIEGDRAGPHCLHKSHGSKGQRPPLHRRIMVSRRIPPHA